MEEPEKLFGIGITIPGIISQEQHLVVKSHALQIENYSLSFLEQAFSCPVYFENDANAAMLAVANDHELDIKSTMMYCHDDYVDAIELVNAGKVHLRPLISKTFAFKDYLKAYQYNILMTTVRQQ